MSATTILALQSLLITLQIVNAGLAMEVHNGLVTLIAGAIVGGLQFFIQHVGNQTQPGGEAGAVAVQANPTLGPRETSAAATPAPEKQKG